MNEVFKIVGQAVMVMEDLGVVIKYKGTKVLLEIDDEVDQHKLSEVSQVLQEHQDESKIFFEKLRRLRKRQKELNIEGEGLLINYKDFSPMYENKLDKWCDQEKFLRSNYGYTYCIKGATKSCHGTITLRTVVKCDYCLKESENRVDISNIINQLPDHLKEYF